MIQIRDKTEMWRSTAGSDGSKGFDGSRAYDGNVSAAVFWSDWYGEPLTWYEPKTDWNGGENEYYNFYDLDAVESNAEYVAELLTDYLAEVVHIISITNRTTKRFEFADSLNRIEGNIRMLANHFHAPTGWETPKTDWLAKQDFSWRDANRLERNLLLLRDLIIKTIASLRYCGTFYAGEDGEIY